MASSTAHPKMTFGPGDVLDGKYRIEALIGRGGMGAVYLARHLELDAPRAIKLMRSELADDEDFVQRFQNEAKLVEGLRHENVVSLYDYARLDDGTQYIVCEYVEGETIRERLERGERFTPRETLDVVREIADGLSAAHEQGILHRDVSPDNIIICDDGQVKILDFGVAKSVVASSAPSTLGLTFGKIGFASPEQRALRSGELLDQRTDVFSLAAVAYAMLTGEAPFRTDDEPAFNHDLHVAREAEVRLRFLSRVEDPCWHQPLIKALARDRIGRPRTVRAFVAALESAVERHARGSCARESGPARRRLYLFAVAAGMAVTTTWCATSVVIVPTNLPLPAMPPVLVTPHLAPVTTPDQATRQQEARDGERTREASTAGEGNQPSRSTAADAPRAEPTQEPPAVATAPPPVPAPAPETSGERREEGVESSQPIAPGLEPAPTPASRALATDTSSEAVGEPERVPEPIFVPPRLIQRVEPRYPPIARRMGVQGEVVVEASITATGTVSDVVVVRSIRLLDDAAIEAVRQWRFEPATLDGTPVVSKASLTVSFQLE